MKSQTEIDLEAELENLPDFAGENETPTSPNADELNDLIKEELNGVKEEESDKNVENQPVEEVKEEAKSEEPAAEEVKNAEEPAQEEQAPLILGKFKSQDDLINAYQNLQKEFSKKSQQVVEASHMSTPDELEKTISEKIENMAVEEVRNTLLKIDNDEDRKEAIDALERYRKTGDYQLVEKARSFLSNKADRYLEVNLRDKAAEIKQDYLSKRDEIELEPVREQLMALEQEDPEWLKDEDNQAIIVEAIKLNRKVDVKGVKQLIDNVAKKAVESYKKSEAVKRAAEAKKAAEEAEKHQTVSVKSSERVDPPAQKKNWFEMSLEEQLMEEYKK